MTSINPKRVPNSNISKPKHHLYCWQKTNWKMEPLVTVRRLMMWISMCPADKSATPQQKWAYKCFTWAVLLFNVIGLIAPLAFCLKYFSVDFNGATFAFMIVIAEFGVIYFLIVAIQMRHQIESIFKNLTIIYNNREFNRLILCSFSMQWSIRRWRWDGISVFGTCEWHQWMDVQHVCDLHKCFDR